MPSVLLPHDPVPWLLAQEGLAAVRARRRLGLTRESDEEAAQAVAREVAAAQAADGSFGGSSLRTAGVLNLLDDLRLCGVEATVAEGAEYLLGVLASQPGAAYAAAVAPGSVQAPLDLCGFFGPYEEQRASRDAITRGAAEMNYYREYEPLTGPKAPVRSVPRSRLDRVGPSSCYSWGLIPLCYTIEALCRAGRPREPRLQPALRALLGVQRPRGGWCRNLGGHPSCTLHALRALAAHPDLRGSEYAEHALRGMRGAWRGAQAFAALQTIAPLRTPSTREMLCGLLAEVAPRQLRNGAFGSPCRVERVGAVVAATKALALPW